MSNEIYLASCIRQFEFYKSLGEKAMEQVSEERLFWQSDDTSNSIATIVYHLHGNMLSRWTDFLTTDGEKPWRMREEEFENTLSERASLEAKWKEGWNCLLKSLNEIQATDLEKIIYIRNQGHTVIDAINRQLCHYSYHIGQIVFLSKLCRETDWQSLSIPKGKSDAYNADKFAQEKKIQHFTDEFKAKDAS
jgi:hypothetical protein